MSKKLKKSLARILAGVFLYAAAILCEKLFPGISGNLILLLFLIAYFVIGGNVVKTAVSNIGHGQVFDENFLMTIATVGAFLVSEYDEAVAVMLFYQIGEWFQSYAVNRSRKSISDLMNIRPDVATVLRDGKEAEVEPDEVAVGEWILIRPGDRVPLDGIVREGSTSLDTMALTGESIPRDVVCGDEIISGCVNLSGVVKVEVTREYGESTVSKILNLVENATDKKAGTENFISKFARYYTPVVVFSALALALIPSLITGSWNVWIYRALSFLVISCPCALVISIPLSFFGGLGGAGKCGILIKGSNYLEALAEAKTVVMDKTGTLTKGVFRVVEIVPDENPEREEAKAELLKAAAYAESYSVHPISLSIQKAYGQEINKELVGQVEELAGYGVSAVCEGKEILAGNYRFMEKRAVACKKVERPGTAVYVAREGRYLGYLVIADEIKEDAPKAVKELYKHGIEKIVMLTGDRKEAADWVADELGIKETASELLPGDKVDRVEALLKETVGKGKLIFVGDGINDAPVLARADIGVAMGGLGSDAAIEAADIVIMTDEPSKIALAMRISGKTLRIVRQNIVFAIGIKILVLLLTAFGVTSMWAAVFADVGVAFLAILNAMRAMRIK